MGEFILGTYAPDSRGNRLDNYEVTKTRGPGPRNRRLYLCCAPEVARQVTWLLERSGYKPRSLELRKADRGAFTHRIEISGPMKQSLRSTLDLLGRVVTLRCGSRPHIALALDFYKTPEDGVDPREWENTESGGLVHRAKYWSDGVAMDQLERRMADVIRAHPMFVGADHVVSVPGHKPSPTSFGVRLARGVAEAVDIPFIETACSLEERPQAKESAGSTEELQRVFDLPAEIDGRVVLIVDDVYMSGRSMAASAAAAEARGARGVVGLVGARTLKARAAV